MKKSLLIAASAFGLALALSASAHAAATGKLEVTKPLAGGTVTITFTANGVTQTVTADVKSTDSAEDKCKKIKAALVARGYTVSDTCPNLSISSLPNGTTGTFDPGKTGEGKDQLTIAAADAGGTPPGGAAMSFSGNFNGVGGDRRPASFTAGVVTDGGSVSVTYSAPSGVLSIPGTKVASQLFAMLSAAVSQAGIDAFLSLNGDQILVEYGSSAGNERGVSFGTTATNKGVVGTVSSFN